MMEKRLFHKKVFWMKSFDRMAQILFNKNYSEHLWEHFLFSKGKHDVTARELDRIIDEIIDLKRNYYLYEVETTSYNDHIELSKAVVRTSYNEEYDVSIVFAKDKVKTAWLNRKNDRHFTLDYKKYYNPKGEQK